MDLIPSLLGEAEFREFTPSDYVTFETIIDDNIAKFIRDYMRNPEADKALVQAIQDNIGDTVTSYTMHFEMIERGIIDMLDRLTPESLLAPDCDLDTLEDKLTYLNDNYNKIKFEIEPRTKDDYSEFLDMMKNLIRRMIARGIQPTYPDIIKRIESNKFVFYIPNDKGHPTGCNTIIRRMNQWKACLSGVKYLKYCNERNIGYVARSNF